MDRIIEKDKLFEFLKSKNEKYLVLASNYFTSKKDPNRKVFHLKDNFDYIKNWYNSVLDFQLNAIVFHDNLSNEFVKLYENENIKFIQVQLFDFSVNDERFFVFEELTNLMNKNQYLLITDINDVEVNKNPMELFSNSSEKIFVGLGDKMYWNQAIWNLKKIMDFKIKTKTSIPIDFFYFPVLNAGLIGGKVLNLEILLNKMNQYFLIAGDSGNYNMVVLNWVIFNYYHSPKRIRTPSFLFDISYSFFIIKHRLKKFLYRRNYNPFEYKGLKSFENELIFSGFPFNSAFRKLEKRNISKAFLIHK